jgi:hypothetical protein
MVDGDRVRGDLPTTDLDRTRALRAVARPKLLACTESDALRRAIRTVNPGAFASPATSEPPSLSTGGRLRSPAFAWSRRAHNSLDLAKEYELFYLYWMRLIPLD